MKQILRNQESIKSIVTKVLKQKHCKNSKWTVDKIFFEVSPLGFVRKDLTKFKKLCKTINSIDIHRLVDKISDVVIRARYYLYTQTNSEWSNPSILKYY